MNTRTTLQFTFQDDIWPIVDQWAQLNGYKLKISNGEDRTYQKGTGFLVAPMMLRIVKEGENITLEAWAYANIVVRIMALFMIPEEMHINPGGFRMSIPRKIARDAVNKLLKTIGQPEIR